MGNKINIPKWATFFTIVGLTILCSLGFWQIERLSWKSELLKEYAAERAKDPLEFEISLENLSNLHNSKTFIRGFIEGIYLHEKQLLLGPRTHESNPGYHLITPFETIDNQIILVNRGWVPINYDASSISMPDTPMIITGTARKIQKGNIFTPPNDPAKSTWYSLDINQLKEIKELSSLAPFVIYLDQQNTRSEYPITNSLEWSPSNNHKSYAIFWFTMAFVLLFIYLIRFYKSSELK